MLTPCLSDLSKHDMKQIPELDFRNLNSAFFECAENSMGQAIETSAREEQQHHH